MVLPAPPPNGTSQCPFTAALPSGSSQCQCPLPATRHSLPARVSSGAVSAPSGSGPYSTPSQHPLPALPPSLPSSRRSFSVSPFGQCSLPVVVELPGSPVPPGQISFPSCPSQRPFPWNVSSRAVFPHSGSGTPGQSRHTSRAMAFPSCPLQRPFPWSVSSRAVFPRSGSGTPSPVTPPGRWPFPAAIPIVSSRTVSPLKVPPPSQCAF